MRPYMRAANVTWAGIDVSDVKEMDFSPQEASVFELRAGDILVGEASGSKREVGKSAIWSNEIPGACFQNTLIRFRPSPVVTPEYAQAHLTHDARRGAFARIVKGVGIYHLSAKGLASWEIGVPPLNEQRRIVAKLDALTDKSRRAKEALDAIPPLLDKLRQSILAAAFRGDLTADWRAAHPDVEPASQLLERIRAERRRRWEEAELAKMKAKGKPPTDDRWKAKYQEPEPVDESGLPELPEGWCWASVEEIAFDVTVGHVGPMQKEYVESGIPFLRSQNVRPNRFSQDGLMFVSPAFHRELSKSRLQPGDVLVVRSGAPGTSCVVPDELAEANCADLLIVRPIKGIEPSLLAFYFNAATNTGQVRQRQVGMAQQHFNVAAIRTLPVPVPPESEGIFLTQMLHASMRHTATSSSAQVALSGSLKDLDAAILAKAFRGELVPQDPNDEPASVLLERIRTESGVQPKQTSRRRKAKPA